MSKPFDFGLATPLDDLTVDAFPSTRSPQEEAPPPDPVLTAEQLAEIRARADAATSAGWGATESGFVESDSGTLVAQAYGGSYQGRLVNARFIARARQDIPALLDHVDALSEHIEIIGEEHDHLVRRSAEEADRAQLLLLGKEEQLAAHDNLHRAAANRIEQLVKSLAIAQEATEAAREIIRQALVTMREPLTHTDARRAREILQKYHHECAIAAVKARREPPAPFTTAPGASL